MKPKGELVSCVILCFSYATVGAIQFTQAYNAAPTMTFPSTPFPNYGAFVSPRGRSTTTGLKMIRGLSPSSPLSHELDGKNANAKRSRKNDNDIDNDDHDNDEWAPFAILLSSFTDGIERSPTAQEFFRYGLVSTLVQHFVHRTEIELKNSALSSPCQGPDVDALNLLEEADGVLERGRRDTDSNAGCDNTAISTRTITREQRADRMLQWLLDRYGGRHDSTDNDNACNNDTAREKSAPLELRIVYIPTAMYALRSDSTNTPGKQRQRARADGKKRRNELVSMVEKLMGGAVNVRAVTLDLDDSSIKQSYTSSSNSNTQQKQGKHRQHSVDTTDTTTSSSTFTPTNGIEALIDWKPHLIYLEGGNTFWLQHCIDKGSWLGPLLSACSSRAGTPAMYIGKSAGAILAGKWMETATWKEMDDPSIVPGREQYIDWKGNPGMNLAGGVSIFPHMNQGWESIIDEKWSSLQQEEEGVLLDGIDDNNMKDGIDTRDHNRSKLYCLSDWDVCCVEGSTKDRFIVSGSKPSYQRQ